MVTLATFDVLDKELSREVANFIKLEEKFRWKNSKVEFHLDPSYWDEFYNKINKYNGKITWNEIKFDQYNNLDSLITTSDIGIYMFIIKANNLIYNLPQFVMYVGISGEGESKRPLKERLSDYFNFNHIKKRKKLHSMLGQYYKQTYIVYSTIKGISSKEVEQLEEDFHGYFVPPANDRDFPVRIKEIIKAQFTR